MKTKPKVKEKKERKEEQPSEALAPIGETRVLELDRLSPNGGNRAVRNDEDLKGLAESIKSVGLLYPLIVWPSEKEKGRFAIIAGERRFRAMKLLKVSSAPCVIVNGEKSDADAEVMRVVENHQRKPLSPLEEASAVRGLLDQGLEIEAVARSLGRSRSWVARRSSLTELSPSWVKAARNPEKKISTWPPSHLEVIARFPKNVQEEIFSRFNNQTWEWTVPTLKDLIRATGSFQQLLASAPWDLEDAALCPKAGACSICPKRSSHHPELFAEEFEGNSAGKNGKRTPGDRCLDPRCWNEKGATYLLRRIETLKKEHSDLILVNTGQPQAVEALSAAFKGIEVRNDFDLVTAKKSDRGARPALIVNGPGLGRLQWVRMVEVRKPARRGKSSTVLNERGEPLSPEESLARKREPYDKRRRQVVIVAVKAKLETLAAAPDCMEAIKIEGGKALVGSGLVLKTLNFLYAMLTEHGWRNDAEDGSLTLPEGLPWETLNKLENGDTGSSKMKPKLFQLCWWLLQYALDQFASRLTVGPNEKINEPHYADVEQICALLGFDLAALRNQAAQTIPYAKSWKGHVADEWVAQSTPAAPADAAKPTASDPAQTSKNGEVVTESEIPAGAKTKNVKRVGVYFKLKRSGAKKRADKQKRAASNGARR